MGEQKRRNVNAPPYPSPWHIPVTFENIPETGQHFELDADAGVRAAVAKVAGLRDLSRLHASFDVMRRGADGLHVLGAISASVGQTCVVTLEPLASEIAETIDLVFIPRRAPEPSGDEDEKAVPRDVKWDDPEPLIDGTVDLGALAAEFLILGLDPYPRKPGAVFESLDDDKPDPGPFAALAKLTKG